MKRIIAVCLALSTSASFAADRDIFDLMYLPKAGTTFGFTGVGLIQGTLEGEVQDIKVDLNGYSVQQTLGHALTNRLLLTASMDFTRVNQETSATIPFFGTIRQAEHTRGLSDPSIGASYRLIDEALLLDLVGEATINTGKPTDRSPRSGHHALSLGAQVGQKSQNFQWAALAQYGRNMEAKLRDGVKEDAHNVYEFELSGLFRLAERSFIRTALAAEFRDGYDDNENEEVSAPQTQYTLTAEYNHVVSADLLLRAGVQYATANVSGIDKYNLWTLVAGALYQF